MGDYGYETFFVFRSICDYGYETVCFVFRSGYGYEIVCFVFISVGDYGYETNKFVLYLEMALDMR